AVYGPDALGGVIHILTHTGLASGARGPIRVVAHATGGPNATLDGAAALRQTGAWSVALEGITTNGEAVLDASGAPIVGSQGEVRTDAERLAATVAWARRVGAARLTARLAADTRAFGATQFYTPFATDTAREATSTGWLQVALAHQAAQSRWRLQAAGRVHRDRYTFFPGLTPNEHTTARGVLTAEASRVVRPGLTLSGGASGEVRAIDSNNQGTHEDASAGVFGLARWSPVAALTFTASARVDADAAYGIEPTPALAVAWQAAPALTLRASGGRAVRAPTYVERYFNTENPRPDGNLGNPDLRAERAWNAEAGADLYPASGVALRATAFWRRTTDLIDFAQLSPEAEFFLAQNVLDARTAGAEVHATLRRTLASGVEITAEAAYTATDIVLSGERPGAVYKYALSHAPHLVQARVALRAGGLTVGVDGLHKTRLGDLSAVTVASVEASAALPLALGGARLEAVGLVRNAGDEEYAEVFGAPMPGRTWHLGLRLAR
ncbi:MAG: TonB-dependent receptor, partial [Bacteroidota bacterium]